MKYLAFSGILVFSAFTLGGCSAKEPVNNVLDSGNYEYDTDYSTERSELNSGASDMDCGDFSSQSEAQSFFESEGSGDPHGLDRDDDGIACETL